MIIISARSLSGLDRDKLRRVLTGIAGVKDVLIKEDEDITVATPPPPGVRVDVPETESSFLPLDLLFAPLHADPRWPRFSAVYRGYRTTGLSAAFAGTFGATFSLYRSRAPFNGQWEFVAQAVFSLFDLSAASLDLVNFGLQCRSTDHVPLRRLSGLLRLHHQSSHLGDELLLSNPQVARVNLSYEELDAKVSYDKVSYEWFD